MGSATSVTCQLLAAFRAAGLNAQYDVRPKFQGAVILPARLPCRLVLPPHTKPDGQKLQLVARVVKGPNKHGYSIVLSVCRWAWGTFYGLTDMPQRKASSREIELTVQDALTRIQQDLGPTGFFLYLASQAA